MHVFPQNWRIHKEKHIKTQWDNCNVYSGHLYMHRCTCRHWIIPLSCSVCSRMTAFNTDYLHNLWHIELNLQVTVFDQWNHLIQLLSSFDFFHKGIWYCISLSEAFKKNFKQSGFTLNILFRVKFSSSIWKVKIQNVFCYKRSLRAFQRQNVPEKP